MSRKISQMTEATEIKSGDISVVVQDGETKQFPLNLLATKAQADEYKTGVETQLTDYEQEITDIKNQYDKELYSPTITVTNTSMVKTGQGDTLDYSASVEDGVVKSAILKGQTLVNLLNNYNNGQYHSTLVSDTDFITFFNMNDKQVYFDTAQSNNNYKRSIVIGAYGVFTMQFTSEEKFRMINLSEIHGWTSENYTDCKVVMLKGDYRNIDIPYFEGMQSVKMPVLTTIGKNLFNLPLVQGSQTYGTIGGKPTHEIYSYRVTNEPNKYIKVKPNTQITFSIINNDVRFSIAELDEHGNRLGDTGWLDTVSQKTITTKSSTHYIGFNFKKVGNTDITVEEVINSNPMFEYSNTSTSYEPHKTNILSTPEDVTLRGIGDVQDTLDCLTGEKVERIGEIVLDGSDDEIWRLDTKEPWTNGEYYTFNIHVQSSSIPNFNVNDILTMNNKYPDISYTQGRNEGIGCFLYSGGGQAVAFRQKDITTLEGWKTHLQSNPITVKYQLATESVKTVVLNPSGTLASEKPYMWKNGSIQLSSNGLVPNLDYAVTTSRVGVIETNMQETITNEKRIHSLEVILAQSTITSAYDTVSLQSDVEMATMSLNENTTNQNEPDAFLYEMILVLIENGAYNLDDLTNKINVFYLYNKLNDEQFMIIMDILYPSQLEEE